MVVTVDAPAGKRVDIGQEAMARRAPAHQLLAMLLRR